MPQQESQAAVSSQSLGTVSLVDPANQLQLAPRFDSFSWPSQAFKAAEQRPCPVKRSSDIFDLIDNQLKTSKRRRIQPAATTATVGQLALLSSQASGPPIVAAPAPAFLHASNGLTSWQSPGKSPFRRHIADPKPSRLSRPASAPFTAGRAPAASPAPAPGRAPRPKRKNDASLLQHHSASPNPPISPVQPSNRHTPSTHQPFRCNCNHSLCTVIAWH